MVTRPPALAIPILLSAFAQKKWGPRLGPGAPEGASQMPVSFSHRRVGSSILASLSEAGGNDPLKPQASPFPLACNSGQFVD